MVIAEYAIANGKPKHLLNQAINLFESVRVGAEPQPELDYNIGNCLHALNRLPEAIARYDMALAVCNDPILRAQILKNQGTCICESGDVERGILRFKESLECDPQLLQAFVSWAATEFTHNNLSKAQELLEECFRYHPDLLDTGSTFVYWLAFALWRQQKWVEALPYLNRYLRAKPADQDALQLKSHLLAYLWRQDEAYLPQASEHFQQVVRAVSHLPIARFARTSRSRHGIYRDFDRCARPDALSLRPLPRRQWGKGQSDTVSEGGI
jgi:tetratricopeptide (TPR) repeat protein